MKKPYKPKDFEALIDKYGNPEDVGKAWAKEEAKFRASIEQYTPEEVMTLLCQLYFEHNSYKSKLRIVDGIVQTQKIGMAILQAISENHSTAPEKVQAMVDQIEHLKVMLSQHEAAAKKRSESLTSGRQIANKKRSEQGQEKEKLLEQAIRAYIDTHSDRKVTNKELAKFLRTTSFSGSQGYSEQTLIRMIGGVAGKIKRNLQSSDS